MLKRLLMMAAMALMALGAAAAGPAIAWRMPSYSLTARTMPVKQALDTFGVAQGIPVVASEKVAGTFSGTFKDVPASEFLDRLATIHNLTWYYDGAAIYVYGASEIETSMMDLAYMKADDVRTMLRELGVEDTRFPIKTASNDELIMVSGPPRYVELVLQTIARADRLKQQRTFNEMETRIFPLKNTWADSVSLRASGPESSAQIRGVAQMLQEIMGTTTTPNSREADSNRVDTAESRMRDTMTATLTPVICADNRLNAVVVRDAAPRMPIYEKLIQQLDVPQKLVEISVTTVEMTRDDALDWQLSLGVHGHHSEFEGAAGQNAQNLFSPTGLGGGGLAGALTYLGKHVDVSASLTALREKGKARNISRTSILTMNNMAAEMTDTQSYHARCVGQEVATLEEVSAGTKLGIKPRIVYPAETNRPTQVWMTMDLQDGGFESVVVDTMPMTRTSTLQTQAAVNEAESILLAGYFRDIQESAGWGIPYLRDIPWIGWIFGGVSHKKETVQRLFILTPHIVVLGPEDLVRTQAARNRDISLEEKLHLDSKLDEEVREEREIKIDEEDKIRRENFDDRMKQERGERNLREQKRAVRRDDSMKSWEEDFKRRKEEWRQEVEAQRQRLEKADKAAAAAEEQKD